MSITLTERAAAEVKKVMEEQGFTTEEYILEAGVTGGGCSGFSYKLAFKEKKEFNPEKENLLTFHGVDVAVGQRALLYMDGTVIDFHDGLDKRGFTFSNPLATGKCGCGSSFSI